MSCTKLMAMKNRRIFNKKKIHDLFPKLSFECDGNILVVSNIQDDKKKKKSETSVFLINFCVFIVKRYLHNLYTTESTIILK